MFIGGFSLCGCGTPLSSRSSAQLLPHIQPAQQWRQTSSTSTQTQTITSTSLALWWSHFDDTQLTYLIDQALAANSNIAIARSALLQSRALRDVAAAGLIPHLGASTSMQSNKTGNTAASNGVAAGFEATWDPDVFGSTRSAILASDANVKAYAATLADMQITIAAN